MEEQERFLGDVQQAIESQDAKALERAAHTLKGALANLSASAACDAAAQLEAIGRQGDLAPARETHAWFLKEIEDLKPVLAALSIEVSH